MAVGQGYVAAGGQNSQLDVRRLAGGEVVYKGHVGGSVNNALHIARDAGHQVGGRAGGQAGREGHGVSGRSASTGGLRGLRNSAEHKAV